MGCTSPFLVRAGLWVGAGIFASSLLISSGAGEAADIELLVRGDDMGSSQAANEACIRAFRNGIVRSVEVIVPGPWFPDAVRLLKENLSLDVGVHLTLTSEWERLKWRPLTHAPSLTDADGYFRPMTSQRKDFPPDTGFLEAKPRLTEVEGELRAQIELAKRHLPQVSHVSAHMGTAVCTPELRALTERLAKEYRVRLEGTGLQHAVGFHGPGASERVQSLARLVETLTPGRWLLVEHPAGDTPEMRALGHIGYEHVAAERDAVTQAFTSPRIVDMIKQRGIRLINYAQLP